MACYVWAALACGRFRGSGEATIGTAMITMTALALVIIAAAFWRALVQLRYRRQASDDPTPEDRTRFMAFTTLLLAGMSWIATLYIGAAAWSIGGCQ